MSTPEHEHAIEAEAHGQEDYIAGLLEEAFSSAYIIEGHTIPTDYQVKIDVYTSAKEAEVIMVANPNEGLRLNLIRLGKCIENREFLHSRIGEIAGDRLVEFFVLAERSSGDWLLSVEENGRQIGSSAVKYEVFNDGVLGFFDHEDEDGVQATMCLDGINNPDWKESLSLALFDTVPFHFLFEASNGAIRQAIEKPAHDPAGGSED